MKIKILFDKDTGSRRLHTGWGISFLVDDKVLFDTGENGFWLMENMKNLNVTFDRIKTIVISHDHWDHTGGLWELLKKKKFTVYACPNFSADFKKKVKRLKTKLVEVKNPFEVSENIFVTGEIAGEYKGEYLPEQALVVKTKKGLTIVTGCSHPGIVKITKEIQRNFSDTEVYLVLGGFHLMKSDERLIETIVETLKKMGVKKVAPTHCSGREAEKIFKDRYGDNFISVKTGQVLRV